MGGAFVEAVELASIKKFTVCLNKRVRWASRSGDDWTSLQILFSNDMYLKNINLAFLLRPSVKLDDLSIQVASTLSQEEVLSRI